MAHMYFLPLLFIIKKGGGQKPRKRLVASMKEGGLILQDLLAVHTNQLAPCLKGVTFHGRTCTGPSQQS